MKKASNKIIFAILAIAAVFLLSKQSKAYDNKRTHPQMVELAIQLYNQKHPDKKITDKELEWIKKGAKEEDEPVARCANHFYDPATGKAIISGADTAIEWAHNSTAQSVSGMGGNFSWEQAKYDFADNNKEKAFQSLGHIMHLLEDMAVPAHVRGDHHVTGGGDLYENWSRDEGENILAENAANCAEIDNCMKDLANFTNNNFLSKDSIKLEKINLSNREKVNGNSYIINSKLNHKLLRIVPNILDESYSFDDIVHSDYWKILSPKATAYGARIIEIFFEEAGKEMLIKKPKTVWSYIKAPFAKVAEWANAGKEAVENNVKSAVDGITDIIKSKLGGAFRDLLAHGQTEVLNEVLPVQASGIEEEEIDDGPGLFYNCEFPEQGGIKNLSPGEIADFSVKVKNTGISDWQKGKVSLNIQTPKSGNTREASPFYYQSWITKLRPADVRQDTESGDIAVINFKIKAPFQAGVYNFDLRPVYQNSSGFHWMGKNKILWKINVADKLASADSVSYDKYANAWTAVKKIASLIDSVDNDEEKKSESKESAKEAIGAIISSFPAFYGNFPASPIAESEVARNESENAEEINNEETDSQENAIQSDNPESGDNPESEIESGEMEDEQEEPQEEAEEIQEENQETEEADEQEAEEEVAAEDDSADNPEQNAQEEENFEQDSAADQEPDQEAGYPPLAIVINEIAWGGTAASSADEWIELFNTTENTVDLSGWKIIDGENQLDIDFNNAGAKIIEPQSYYLIERSEDDNSISDIIADFAVSFAGGLKDLGEKLTLLDPAGNMVDETDASYGWFNYADKDSRVSMERINTQASGSDPASWISNDKVHINGLDADGNPIFGTPSRLNSVFYQNSEEEPVSDLPDSEDDLEEDNPENPIEPAASPMLLSEYDSVRFNLKTAVYNNRIYYLWSEQEQYISSMSPRYIYTALGSSELNGNGFKYAILNPCGKNQDSPNFTIYNNQVYLAWFEATGTNLYNQKLYDLFIARADLGIIEDGPNESNFKKIQITNGGLQFNLNIDIKIVNQKIRMAWSGNPDPQSTNLYGNKITMIDIDPADFENIPAITSVDSRLTGWESEIHSIISGGSQYFVWYCDSIFQSCQIGTLGWGRLDLESGNFQDFYSADQISHNPIIAKADEGATLLWSRSNTIKYSDFNNFQPNVLISGEETREVVKAEYLNGKTEILAQEDPMAENSSRYYKLSLYELNEGNITEIFTYEMPQENGTYDGWITSSSFEFLGENPAIIWTQRNNQEGAAFRTNIYGMF